MAKKHWEPKLFTSPINLPQRTVGDFAIQHQMVKERTPIVGTRQAILRGIEPVFAKLKKPLRVHHLTEKGVTWMTDLPEELNQIGEMLYDVAPSGNILVGGLGLGIVATVVSRLPTVMNTHVVELQKEVIELAADGTQDYAVIHADIHAYLQACPSRYDCYLLDTWRGTNEIEWWRTVLPLRRLIRNKHGIRPVIHCWAEDIMWEQVKRRLTLMDMPEHWYYHKPFFRMTSGQADWFRKFAGTPAWEHKYGEAFDRLLCERKAVA